MTRAIPWFRDLARWYARRRVGSTFDGLHVCGMDAVRALARQRPLVLATNHAAWWDSFVIQGEQRPSHLRPLGLQRGVGLLAGLSAAEIVPVSITYAVRASERPSIVVSLGEPCRVLRRGPPDELEVALIGGLDKNDAFLVSGSGAFAPLVASPRSGSVPLHGRVLARLAGAAFRQPPGVAALAPGRMPSERRRA